MIELSEVQYEMFLRLVKSGHPAFWRGGSRSLSEQGYYEAMRKIALYYQPPNGGPRANESYAFDCQIRTYLSVGQAMFEALLLRERGQALLWRHVQEVCEAKAIDVALGIRVMLAIAQYDRTKEYDREFSFQDDLFTRQVVAPLLGYVARENGDWAIADAKQG